MTAVGPGSRELVAARDRRGGLVEHGDRRSPRTYVADPIVIALAGIVRAADAHRRRRLAVVTSDPE